MENQQSKKPKTILPAPASESGGSSTVYQASQSSGPTKVPKRSNVKVACESCRRKRAKCDGQRPVCGPCIRKTEKCVYEAEEGETATGARKRKTNALEDEVIRYRDLFHLLRTKPDGEAHEILHRIRVSDDPLFVLEEVRDDGLLLVEPEFSERVNNDHLAKLDGTALEKRVIKVPARPWTSVAGDGLVSELITEYFTWENAYLFPSVDRKTFVEEMREKDIEAARWCSPPLQIHHRSNLFGAVSQQSMTEQFLDEAKELLDRQQGRPSIPAAQALMLMYLTMTCLGKDRPGRMCRQYALDMVHRLKLETRYGSHVGGGDTNTKEKRLIAKAFWGLFMIETLSRVAILYFQPSQISPPGIPHPFGEENSILLQNSTGNVDVLDRPFEESPCQTPLVPGVLVSACSLAVLFYEVMKHNTNEETVWGSDSDICIQKRLYSRLRHMQENLPRRFLVENNFTPSTCFLRLDFNEVAFGIIQTLRHQILFETPASQPGTTVKDLCVLHCRSAIETLQSYLAIWPFDLLQWKNLYLPMQLLVLLFDEPFGCELFTQACKMMRRGVHTFRICRHLLQATMAFAWAIGKSIPDSASLYFEGLKDDEMARGDLPVSFALPQLDDIKDLLKGNGKDYGNIEEDLGALIEKWALQE